MIENLEEWSKELECISALAFFLERTVRKDYDQVSKTVTADAVYGIELALDRIYIEMDEFVITERRKQRTEQTVG